MKYDDLTEIVATAISQSIIEEASVGSPMALSRFSRSLRQLPDIGIKPLKCGASFLAEVFRTLFKSRNPQIDYDSLRSTPWDAVEPDGDVFELCGRAIAVGVFRRDWVGAEALFERASIHAAAFRSPIVNRAVEGLKERFLLLPRSGSGVRSHGCPSDLLWRLNRAEECFCKGDLVTAQLYTRALLSYNSSFGWARSLLIRMLFAQSDFEQARAVLVDTELGSLGAAEELGWNSLLPCSATSAVYNMPPHLTSLSSSHTFRLPIYFEALGCLLRGDSHTGRYLLQTGIRTGEVHSLMAAHDPIARFTLRFSASANDTL